MVRLTWLKVLNVGCVCVYLMWLKVLNVCCLSKCVCVCVSDLVKGLGIELLVCLFVCLCDLELE